MFIKSRKKKLKYRSCNHIVAGKEEWFTFLVKRKIVAVVKTHFHVTLLIHQNKITLGSL